MTESVSSNQNPSHNSDKNSSKLTLSLDFRVISLMLLLVIALMLALWRPWSQTSSNSSRTISVSGQATLKETPDEFVFMPQYTFENADKTAALDELTAKQTSIVDGLKKLGVKDEQIKADSSGNDYAYFYDDTKQTNNYTLGLTVTLTDKDLTQKVQDYLVTTQPTGSVSPMSDFSDAKRKQLESQGRDEAAKDARSKAEQSAKNLGFTIGKVKSISDGTGGGMTVQPMMGISSSTMSVSSSDIKQGVAVQTGQNELSYSVEVMYYIH